MSTNSTSGINLVLMQKSKKHKQKHYSNKPAVNLYQLKSRINQLYFSTFLTRRHTILISKQEQLDAKIKEIR
jgi:hypothetical protein